MRGDVLQARLLKRITDSAHRITVLYPPARVPVTGASPGDAPVSPLTGAAPTQTVFPRTPPEPSKPSVTLPCLWYDAPQLLPHRLRAVVNSVSFINEADAWAQVRVLDAAADPADPAGDNVFTGCEVVVHQGHRYRVLGTQAVGAGHRDPSVIYVWLTGAVKQ